MDEGTVAEHLQALKTHETNMDFMMENIGETINASKQKAYRSDGSAAGA